jgi:prevent-host-death family protein
MQISVTEAKGQLTELVRRAEAGKEVILTRHGYAIVRLVRINEAPDGRTRRALLEALRASASATAGPSADRGQDFLYGDGGTDCFGTSSHRGSHGKHDRRTWV